MHPDDSPKWRRPFNALRAALAAAIRRDLALARASRRRRRDDAHPIHKPTSRTTIKLATWEPKP